MSNFPLIDKDKVFTDSPDGLVLSDEAHIWLDEVLDMLNFIVQTSETKSEKARKDLARLIFAINHEQSGCKNHEKCKAKLEVILCRN